MSGTVNIARSLFDHAVFNDEPLTQREAWIWLIMEASWKPRARRVGSVVVQTLRGQVASSVRFMAGAWKWTPAKVQRYLKRLEKMEMIQSQADTGVTVVTICNYDEYQSGGKAADTGPIQDRYRTDTNEKKDEIREEGKREDDADASLLVAPPTPGPSFEDFWSVWPLGKISKQNAEKAFRKLSQPDRIAATERAPAWAAHWRRNHPIASPIHPASYLNARRWTDEIQPNLTLLPGGPREPSRQDHRDHSAVHPTNRAIAIAAGAARTPNPDWH